MDIESIMLLRSQGRNEDARRALVPLAAARPADARVQYETACVHDVLGLESEAVPYYLKAIELGLPKELLQEAYLGLGSTYRSLGRYPESEAILRQGTLAFPAARALRVFYAMTLYNLGRHKESTASLLRILSETSRDAGITRYGRAIELYAQDLDRTW